ncbi:MAG: FecR family protein [Treponema sp.]|jgi:hypothetical protein|nr:FecR family protein [Treponema sp.]
MKKNYLVSLFLVVCFGTLSQSVFAQNEFANEPLFAVIQELSGTVEIKSPNTNAFTAAQIGDKLNQDTLISTGFRSYAIIAIGNTSITVRPISRLTLLELHSAENIETMNVNLQAGRVRVDVKPPAGRRASFSVQSNMAVASVRGTSFEFDTRNLYVSDGTVNFAGNRGQQVPVRAGSENRITADGSAANPIEEKLAGLLPPSPPGAEGSSGLAGAPVKPGINISLGLEFIE